MQQKRCGLGHDDDDESHCSGYAVRHQPMNLKLL